MNSVRHQRSKIFGIVLCAVLVLSVYVGVVGFVSELFGNDFIEMVTLSSKTSSQGSCQFAMGDTILVSASVKRGNAYRLNVYDGNDRLVFITAGAVNGSTVNVSVPVQPPAFNASRTYSLSFEARVVSYPLPGVDTFDSSAELFTVVKSPTTLRMTTDYAAATHTLRSLAFLATADAVPLENATVSFYLQPNVDFVKPDRGWTLLGSAETGADGFASYSCVLSMMGGNHALEARFAGSEGYGSSTASSQFSVSYRPTLLRIVSAEKTASSFCVVLQLTDPSGFPLGGKVLSFEALGVTPQALFAVTNGTGFAVMSFSGLTPAYLDSRLTVLGDDYISSYQACVRLAQNGSAMIVASEWGESGDGSLAVGEESPSLAAVFQARASRSLVLLDDELFVSAFPSSGCVDLPETITTGLTSDGPLGNVTFNFYANGTLYIGNSTDRGTRFNSTYTYGAMLYWYPEACGNYSIDVYASDAANDTWYGETAVGVERGHCNLVVYYPGAFCGDMLNLTVALSKVRTQNQSDFQTVDFAPTVLWNDSTYALDQPTQSPTIHVYVNGSSAANLNNTDGSGVCTCQLPLNSSTFPARLNITAAIDQSDRFQQTSVSQIFNLTRVSVRDDPSVAANASTFYMNYTMSVLKGTDTTYVNSSNTVETQVTVLNRSAYNVTASFTTGYLGNRAAPDAYGNVTIPTNNNSTNYTLLRVVCACQSDTTPLNPWADINKDGIVDMMDIALVAAARFKYLGDTGYNWTLDVNADGGIDMTDIAIVAANFLKDVYYPLDGFDYRGIKVSSSNGSNVSLDSRGFAAVPSGAKWLNVSANCDVEFFYSVSNTSSVTDNGGRASVIWNPSMAPGVCVAEDKLPTPLNLTVAADNATAQLNASLCMANYYYVFKRPVDVSLSWDSQLQTPNLTACADTYAVENDTNTHGSEYIIDVSPAGQGGPECIGYILFDLASIPVNASILSARLDVHGYLFPDGSSGSYMVNRVLGSWSEQTLNWFNKPRWNSTPSYTLQVPVWHSSQWYSFDVTSDVRYWSTNSTANFGFALLASSDQPLMTLSSRNNSQYAPSLEVCYLNGSQHVCVSAYDEALGCLVPNLNVAFIVNGTVNASGYTDPQTGVWDRGAWWPSTGGTWSLGANSTGNAERADGTTSTMFNLGLPTSMVSLDDGSTDLTVGSIISNFSLCSSQRFNVSGVTVNFCVTGTYSNGTVWSGCTGSNTTLNDGSVSFAWKASDVGTFSVHASFPSSTSYASCDAYALATVHTVPLSVLFSVSPDEFLPGTQITLNATIMNPLTNSLFNTHDVAVRFFDFVSNGTTYTVGTVNSTGGVATLTLNYPSDNNAHAYNATILYCTDGYRTVSNVVSSPVQLAVGWNTTLSLNVWNTSSAVQYRVGGSLMNGSQGLANRQVTLQINDTQLNATTAADGGFSATIDFPAVSNQNSSYTVTASFGGENASTASATAIAVDGSSYVSCTTTEFSLQPSSNSTVLTVSPQSALATMLTKTPKQMQQDAQDSGWMPPPKSEFSIFYPWFRLHYQFTPNGIFVFDVGISPLPFANTVRYTSALTVDVTSWLQEALPGIAIAIALSESLSQIAAQFGPEGFIAALLMTTETLVISLIANWNSVEGLLSILLGLVCCTVITITETIVFEGIGVFGKIVDIVHEISNLWDIGFGTLYNIISIPINIAFMIATIAQAIQLGVNFTWH